MRQITLANLVLDPSSIPQGGADLLYRAQGTAAWMEGDPGALEFAGELDLLTYLNSLSLGKWRQYAQLGNLHAEVEIEGDADVQVRRAYAHDMGDIVSVQQVDLAGATRVAAQDVEADPLAGLADKPAFDAPLPATASDPDSGLDSGFVRYRFSIPIDDATLVGLALIAPQGKKARLRSGRFATCIQPEQLRDVSIALCTTTYRNEDYILPNMRSVIDNVMGPGQPTAGAFHMFVVDNGGTLDAETLREAGFEVEQGEGGRLLVGPDATVCPNPNVGGAGGFARGMMEALDADGTESEFTHVLLMDDDVMVMPESFKRTHALLQLASDGYRDAFLNGAMMKLQDPTIYFEDVAHTRAGGSYGPYKEKMDMTGLANLVFGEATPVEGKRSYGAWWYSCIPISAIRRNGLPLPVFVRCDDVEYGVRCNGTYMSMAGICVWHSQFNGRFRASVDLYQYGRNTLIITACDQHASQAYFMAKYWRNLQVYLRFMAYESAELWLDALEDYLEGPAFLVAVDGAQLMARNAAKNEKLVPLDQLDQKVVGKLDVNRDWLGHDDLVETTFSKILDAIPHDRHFMPDALLNDEPGFVDYSGSLSPWEETAMRRTLVALDATGENGHIRTLDRARHWGLIIRFHRLLARYLRENQGLKLEYRNAMPYLTSREFWDEHLQEAASR